MVDDYIEMVDDYIEIEVPDDKEYSGLLEDD